MCTPILSVPIVLFKKKNWVGMFKWDRKTILYPNPCSHFSHFMFLTPANPSFLDSTYALCVKPNFDKFGKTYII